MTGYRQKTTMQKPDINTNTRVKVIIDDKYSWCSQQIGESKIYFKGFFLREGELFSGIAACDKLYEIFINNCEGKEDFRKKAPEIKGNFSLILDSKGFLIAAVDRIRSFPVFFTEKDKVLYLSNCALRLQSETGLHRKDKLSALEFEMAGYVTGSNTLFENLQQVQAGELIIFSKKNGLLEKSDYYIYREDNLVDKAENLFIAELGEVAEKIFTDLIKTLNNRPVYIPLSGGLDSRWILSMLICMKYKNIVTFSYGKSGHPEVARAKLIADKLKVKWTNVTYNPKEIKEFYNSNQRREYFRFADGLCSVPFLNDFYALWIMKDKKAISDDAIFINGQTGDFLTGGHIPENINSRQAYDTGHLLKSLIDKHFSLWVNLKTEENTGLISGKILKQLELKKGGLLSGQEVAQYFELWEWRERQAKFVVNGQRTYEWFGYEWRLPLWSHDLMDFWAKIPLKFKYGRRLHKFFLNEMNYAGVFNNYYMGPHPVRMWEKVAAYSLLLHSKFSKKDVNMLANKYLRYFGNYSPFYSYIPYSKYLKDSYWHRNLISYLAREILEGYSCR